MGDELNGRAAAFRLGCGLQQRANEVAAWLIDLSEEQRTVAREIFPFAGQDTCALREAPNEEIRSLLSREQMAEFDRRREELEQRFAAIEGFGGHESGSRFASYGSLDGVSDLSDGQRVQFDELRTEYGMHTGK